MDSDAPFLALVISLLVTALRSGTPILIAVVGELYAEKSGVLNMSVEGMMLMGAVACFAGTYITGSTLAGVLLGVVVGGLFSLIHGFLAITVGADQTVSGVVLALLGGALSDFLGRPLIGINIPGMEPINIPFLSDIPVLGPLLFQYNALVYVALILSALTWVVFRFTKVGMTISAVGEDPRTADIVGINVARVRYVSVFVGGLLAGLAGAYMSSAFNAMWTPGLTGGRGWIAVAVVNFSMRKVDRVMLGAFLFGGIEGLQMRMQAMGIQVSSKLLNSLPYVATILVLVLFAREEVRKRMGAPAGLGIPYRRE